MMELEIINKTFSVCRIPKSSQIDLSTDFIFTGCTDQEFSLVCPQALVPNDAIYRDDSWKCFRIKGVLDFSLIGILSKISALLAENEIGIFVVSTYNTDYIFVKAENFTKSIDILSYNGYVFL